MSEIFHSLHIPKCISNVKPPDQHHRYLFGTKYRYQKGTGFPNLTVSKMYHFFVLDTIPAPFLQEEYKYLLCMQIEFSFGTRET